MPARAALGLDASLSLPWHRPAPCGRKRVTRSVQPLPFPTMRHIRLAMVAAALVALATPPSVGAQGADTAAAAGGPRTAELPLKPERNVKFTTEEGTWMSLDVSPDGRTIVFDLVGDIYTVPIGGG